MKILTRIKILIPIVLVSLLLVTSTVFAEGETPPEVPADEPAISEPMPADDPILAEQPVEEEITAPACEPVVLEETAQDPPAVQEPAAVEEPAAEPPAAEEPAPSAETPVEALPAETAEAVEAAAEAGLTLVDANGEALDLASTESEQALLVPDPYYYVGAVKYSFVTINDAINNIAATGVLPTDGKIYVESGTYTEDVEIDGTDPTYGTTWSKLKGLVGVTLPGLDTPVINGYVYVNDTLLGFTLSNFVINDEVVFDHNTGALVLTDLDIENSIGNGLTVSGQNGTVDVRNVESSENQGYGAVIDNTRATSAYVKVFSSEFDDNDDGDPDTNWAGLEVRSNGAVTIDGISASRNGGDGADFTQFLSLTVKNSAFIDNEGTYGWGDGLYVDTSLARPVILDMLIASDNNMRGMYIHTNGPVTTSNIETMYNGGWGMQVDNSSSASPAAVSVRYGTFNNNGSGLYLNTKGNVSLHMIQAAYNTDSDGAYIDTCIWNSSTNTCSGVGTITLTSDVIANSGNYFGDNSNGNGLYIYSKGNVTLTNFDGTNNGGYGTFIDACQEYNGKCTAAGNVSITVTLQNWLNGFENNLSGGLYVDAGGTITIDKAGFRNNGYYGAELHTDSALAARAVTISNSDAMDNYYAGLVVFSSGNITLSKCTNFNNNGHNPSEPGSGVYLETTAPFFGTVTVTGSSASNPTQIVNNESTGMFIKARGAVTIASIHAENNGNGGVTVDAGAAAMANVSVTSSQMTWNGGSMGLYVETRGNILLNTVDASGNGIGAWLDNCLYDYDALLPNQCAGKGTVTITAPAGVMNLFNDNGQHGLYIGSKANVAITNIIADNNGFNGVEIYNNYPGSLGTVTITALGTGVRNSISQNGGGGQLAVQSFGAISINLLDANCLEWGWSEGVTLDNYFALPFKPVMVTNSTFNGHDGSGLTIHTRGLTTLSGVEANNNSWDLYNVDLRYDHPQTIHEYFGESVYNPNTGWWSGGRDQYTLTGDGNDVTITVTSQDFLPYIQLWGDSGDMSAGDDDGDGSVSLTVSDTVFDGWYGFWVSAYQSNDFGNYEITFDDDNESGEVDPEIFGIRIDGCYWDDMLWDWNCSAGSGGVTVTKSAVSGFGVRVKYNKDNGLDIPDARGAVMLTDMTAYGNGVRGIGVDNSQGASFPMSFTGVYADHNKVVGIVAFSKGAFTWMNGSAVGNSYEGGMGFLNFSGIPSPVTITNVNFDENGNTPALFILSPGAVTLTDINARNNPNAVGVMIIHSMSPAPIVIKANPGKVVDLSGNGQKGLVIQSIGPITLTNVTANNNGAGGAELNNSDATLMPAPMVTITNGNFNNNTGDGLVVNSKGNILLTNVNAMGNSVSDGWVDAYGWTQREHIGNGNYNDVWHFQADGSGTDVFIELRVQGSVSPYFTVFTDWGQPVAYSEIDEMTDPSYAWLNFYADPDAVYYLVVEGGSGFYDLYFNDDGSNFHDSEYFYGARLDNCQEDGGVCTGSGLVTITSPVGSDFSGNNGTGLEVKSKGAVSITNTNARGNGDYGIHAVNAFTGAPVEVKCILTTQGQINQNANTGLHINTYGLVTLTNLYSRQNGGHGIYLDNSGLRAAAVNLNRIDSWGNGENGIEAHSWGAITYLTSNRAVRNNGYGILLDNSQAPTVQPVTLKQAIGVNGNNADGVRILSLGNVTVDSVKAEGNGNCGVYIDNSQWDGYIYRGTGTVSMLGTYFTNIFNNNGSYGLKVHTNRSFTGTKINAEGNQNASGIYIDNSSGSGSVTLTTASLRNNAFHGIEVYSNGPITLNGVVGVTNGFNPPNGEQDGDGAHLVSNSGLITFMNCSFVYNWGNGIDTVQPSTSLPVLINTSYFGNDVNRTGERNLYDH